MIFVDEYSKDNWESVFYTTYNSIVNGEIARHKAAKNLKKCVLMSFKLIENDYGIDRTLAVTDIVNKCENYAEKEFSILKGEKLKTDKVNVEIKLEMLDLCDLMKSLGDELELKFKYVDSIDEYIGKCRRFDNEKRVEIEKLYPDLFKSTKWVALTVYAIFGVIMFLLVKFVPCTTSVENKKIENQTSENRVVDVTKNKTPEIEEEKKKIVDAAVLKELIESYNKVLSNTLNGLYDGCRFRGQYFVVVYVNSNWYYLNKGQKEIVVERVVKTYAGMNGARGLEFDIDKLHVYIKSPTSERTLADWGPIMGIEIEE